uniref:Non-ribosomal peptide synthase n=1 Tax=Nostoc sp. 'Peltigera membranacea cyanobiont' TaxID=414689 RepID=M4T9Q5_9NOSO|nr:non-ribosomal peptide synthase [Nostoc sp. 'Peltigera membranacea cyanobiont']
MISTKIRENLIAEDLFAEKIFWLNQLSGELPETNFITDYVRPPIYAGNKNSLSFELSSDLSQAILSLTKNSNFSTYLVLLTALSILLQKSTRNNDVIVGSPIYQPEASDESLINKLIPLRLNVINQLLFKDCLLQVKEKTIEAYIHQNYPLDDLMQLLNIPNNQNRCPIFDIVVLLRNIHSFQNIAELKNDLTFAFEVQGNLIKGQLHYNTDLFREDNITKLINYLTNIIESTAKNLYLKISEIPILNEFDRQQLLQQFNDNAKNYPVNQTIHTLFEKQVEQTPDNIAVVFERTHLTYRQLNEKANQLARFLQTLGVKKGEFIGILKDRDINFVIGILAIYKAGGAYVPIDSTYPLNRIEYMVANSEVRVILTDSSCFTSLGGLIENCPHLESLICLDINPQHQELLKQVKFNIFDRHDFDDLLKENLGDSNVATDPAYMLYTSGSTGFPKGAIVRHDGAINHIYAQFDELELTEEFAFLQSAPSSTDISVWQFLAPLLIGGRTVIVDIETVALPDKLFKVLQEQKITVVELVPALFKGLLDYTSQLSNYQRVLADLKWMMIVGEPVPVRQVNQWLNLYPSIRVANAYGPTEAADDITQFIVDKPLPDNQRTVSIGKPLANLNIYIVDSEMNLVPIGIPGEICVSGIGVGDGYWKNEEKTNLSFVPNPFAIAIKVLPGNRKDLIYKTGDLGRWLPDGNIEFLGRIDHQVKIRGFRIELGEIEAQIAQHPSVREAVVIAYKEEWGNHQLVAYVVANTGLTLTMNELRSFLTEKLPDYMLPSALVILENLPLAPSGKVDRKALPKPDMRSELETTYVMPRNEVERLIASIWQQALNLEKVGIQDNFFDLGGHSLIMIQVLSKLREILKVDLAIVDLFKYPSISSLSQYLSQEAKDDSFTDESNEQNEKLEAGKGRLKQRLAQRKKQNL